LCAQEELCHSVLMGGRFSPDLDVVEVGQEVDVAHVRLVFVNVRHIAYVIQSLIRMCKKSTTQFIGIMLSIVVRCRSIK
jgi:hypothetical protein